MRVIIAGSRGITDVRAVEQAIAGSPFKDRIAHVISGGASGVDTLGERWARGMQIPWTVYPARWDEHGKSAGPIRNKQMAANADALIAVWDGESKGTQHMIETADKCGLETFVYRVDQ